VVEGLGGDWDGAWGEGGGEAHCCSEDGGLRGGLRRSWLKEGKVECGGDAVLKAPPS
jgi:hypothetical protein